MLDGPEYRANGLGCFAMRLCVKIIPLEIFTVPIDAGYHTHHFLVSLNRLFAEIVGAGFRV